MILSWVFLMFENFNVLDVDSRRATLSAMTILSILLLLCCLSKWILYGFTALFIVFALILAYKEFVGLKSLKKRVKSNV
jgi:hypothetical protein